MVDALVEATPYPQTDPDDNVPVWQKLDVIEREGILPDFIGWNIDCIHEGLDAIVLGMHAREDNPELLRAQELGLKIFSYPEYLYEQA